MILLLKNLASFLWFKIRSDLCLGNAESKIVVESCFLVLRTAFRVEGSDVLKKKGHRHTQQAANCYSHTTGNNNNKVKCIHYQSFCTCVYNFILKLNYILRASYSLSRFFNITVFQDVRDSQSHRKQLTSYLVKIKLNITQGKE